MYQFLFIAIIAVFVGLLFLNFYFRWKVFKVYKYLVQNKVEFELRHFFSADKMEAEILPRYPQHREQILKFVSMVHRSVQLASGLIVIILAMGYLLMKFS